jgi:muconate cycloisomerase
VIAAVEIAVADALGREKGLRIADLYGGARRQSLAQKWLIGAPRIEDELAEVDLQAADGIFLFMLKVGSKPLEHDVLLAQRLRERFGGRIQLCADANGAWTKVQAMSYLTQLQDIGLLYLEQPLPAGELGDAAAIASAVTTPLSLDEGVAGAFDIFAAWQRGATSGAILKPSKYGGLARALEAGTLCATLGLKVGLATQMAESSICTAAALQIAAALPEVAWDIGPSSDYLAEDLVEVPIRHAAGRLHIGTGHGLGIEISRRQVERFRLDR